MLEILKEKRIAPTNWEKANGISKGYIKSATEAGRTFGLDIVEKFLLAFPEVDANWLITSNSRDHEKLTPASKVEEPELIYEKEKLLDDLRLEVKMLREEVRHLRDLSSSQAESILNFSRRAGVPDNVQQP